MTKNDDTRAGLLEEFFLQRQALLRKQGAIVAGWRYHAGKKNGPYYRLDVRLPGGRTAAFYLGTEGPLVIAARQRLAEVQQPRHQQLQDARVRRQLLRDYRAAQANVALELEKVGLRRQGEEIRGISSPGVAQKLAAQFAAGSPPQNQMLEKSEFC